MLISQRLADSSVMLVCLKQDSSSSLGRAPSPVRGHDSSFASGGLLIFGGVSSRGGPSTHRGVGWVSPTVAATSPPEQHMVATRCCCRTLAEAMTVCHPQWECRNGFRFSGQWAKNRHGLRLLEVVATEKTGLLRQAARWLRLSCMLHRSVCQPVAPIYAEKGRGPRSSRCSRQTGRTSHASSPTTTAVSSPDTFGRTCQCGPRSKTACCEIKLALFDD